MPSEKQKSKRRVFFIAKKDIPIFRYLREGKKTVETRAATPRNRLVQKGDIAVFICNKKRIEKSVRKVSHFKTIGALLKKYPARRINPSITSASELTAMYRSFPHYKEKIKQFGILAFELES